jgi:hypothetical protein
MATSNGYSAGNSRGSLLFVSRVVETNRAGEGETRRFVHLADTNPERCIYTTTAPIAVSDLPMTKVLPVVFALIPLAALVGACAVTG